MRLQNFHVDLNSVLDVPIELQVGGGIIVVVSGVLISTSIIEKSYVRKGRFVEAERVTGLTHIAIPIVIGCMLLYVFVNGVSMFL